MISFGCYPGSKKEIQMLLNQQDLVVVVWAGSDAMYMRMPKHREMMKAVKKASHFRHIAISQYIVKDLKALGIRHEFLPVSQVNESMFSPEPMGDSIFFYDSVSSRKSVFYGSEIVKEIKAKMPGVKFVSGAQAGKTHVSYASMPDVYRKCFLGLRPTPHDGLPNTAVELGLMGRRCICNHELPNCLRYRDVKDIMEIIEREQGRIGQTDVETAEKMKRYISIPDNWLNEDHYG